MELAAKNEHMETVKLLTGASSRPQEAYKILE
jgi:hypothetical protein